MIRWERGENERVKQRKEVSARYGYANFDLFSRLLSYTYGRLHHFATPARKRSVCDDEIVGMNRPIILAFHFWPFFMVSILWTNEFDGQYPTRCWTMLSFHRNRNQSNVIIVLMILIKFCATRNSVHSPFTHFSYTRIVQEHRFNLIDRQIFVGRKVSTQKNVCDGGFQSAQRIYVGFTWLCLCSWQWGGCSSTQC